MLLHQLQGVRLVLEIADVAELVDLVIADALIGHEAYHVLDVVHAGCHHGHARAGEGHLGGGGELEDHIRAAGLAAEGEHVREGDVVPLELMDAVGVVPHDHEVRGGGLQAGNAVDGLGAVDDALGVGILGHAPDTLDSGVLDGLLHRVHVRAGGRHGDGDQLHAEGLGHIEVAVIAGGGAQKFHRIQLAPGLLAVEQTVGEGLGNGVIHQGETGVAADEALLRFTAQDFSKELFRAGQTGELAIVAHVKARLHAVLRLGENGQHIADQVQLLLPGLAPGHVQLQSFSLQIRETLGYGLVLGFQLRGGHGFVFHLYLLLLPRQAGRDKDILLYGERKNKGVFS